jgi:hypothetical protein
VVLAVATGLGALYVIDRSDFNTGVGYPLDQPLQFSHEHHVAGLGIDCRYCHQSVEQSAFAGIPAASVCMNCHAQIWSTAAMLEPVRASYENGTAILWQRVNDLPDFTYFNHAIHVAKGIGCESCHGRIDQMPLTWKAATLKMEWCLECHRDPVKHLRPRAEITTMGWQAPPGQDVMAYRAQLAKELGLRRLTDCSTCHR